MKIRDIILPTVGIACGAGDVRLILPDLFGGGGGGAFFEPPLAGPTTGAAGGSSMTGSGWGFGEGGGITGLMPMVPALLIVFVGLGEDDRLDSLSSFCFCFQKSKNIYWLD